MGSIQWRLSSDGKLLAVGCGPKFTVALIDTATGLEVRQIKVSNNRGHVLHFSPDNTRLVTAGRRDGGVEVHDVKTGASLATFKTTGNEGPSFMALSADGKWLAFAGEWERGKKFAIKVWNLETNKEFASLDGLRHDRDVQLALSPDGKVLANWGQTENRDKTDDRVVVQLWDVARNKEVRRIPAEYYNGPAMAAFSPDGKQIALAEGSPTTRSFKGISGATVAIWDVASGAQLRRLAVLRGSGAVLRYSPDGKVLAVGTEDGVIQTWDVASGKRLDVSSGPECSLASLVFAGEKMLAAGWKNQAVFLWEPSSGRSPCPQDEPTARITDLTFSRDGKVLISAADTVLWWDVATGKTMRQFSPRYDADSPGSGNLTMKLSPDGKFVCVSRQDMDGMRIFGLDSGQELCDLPRWMHENRHAFAGDGKTFAVLGREGREPPKGFQGIPLGVWDLSSGQQRHRLDVRMMGELAVSPDGRLAVTRGDRAMQLWDLSTGKATVKIPLETAVMRFSNDGSILATLRFKNAKGQFRDEDYERNLVLWDTAAGTCLRTLERFHDTYCGQVHLSPDGRLVAAVVEEVSGPPSRLGSDTPAQGKVILWELASGKVRTEFRGHRGSITALAFAPDCRTLATGGDDTTVLLWDLVGRLDNTARPGAPRTEQEMTKLWAELEGDARAGHQAMVRLTAAGGQTVALLRQRIPPAPGKGPDAKEIDRLITDLDSDAFEVREKASRALEAAGKLVRPALVAALAASPSPEKKRRAQELLDTLSTAGFAREMIRPTRALEVLERLGTPEALKLVQELARGNPTAPLTVEAKSVLRRMVAHP